MQRDLKIGISLCVLMFGVVGALMFRREQPSPKAQGLQLKTARQLDQKIAQRARTPYMTGEIEHDEEPTSGVQDPPDGTRPAHLQPPLHLTEEDDGILAPPGPTESSGGKGPTGSDAIPHRSRGRGEIPPRIVTGNVTAGPQTHTIRTGDTLSSIAEKYLGSQKRFQEIFDANRDVLTSPNRLPDGVVITIPPATKEVRRIADQGTSGSRVTHETRRPNVDLSGIQPIAPGNAEPGFDPVLHPSNTSSDHDAASSRTNGGVEVEGNTTESRTVDSKIDEFKSSESKSADTKLNEPPKKRFFAPSRPPFVNNPNPRSSVQRKPADAASELATDSKESRGVDPAHESTRQAYLVRKGDSLERISQRVYGNPRRAADIFNANRDKLASPDAVKEGLELALP